MLIAEELHLLLTDHTGAPIAGAGYRAHAEIAALVIDLMIAGRLRVGTDEDARVEVTSTVTTGRALLDTALEKISAYDGERLRDIVTLRELDPWDDIVASLVAGGVLAERGTRVFGLGSPYSRVLDATAESRTRQRLADVLASEVEPTLGDAVLLQLLQAIGVAPTVLASEAGGRDPDQLRARIEQVPAGVQIGGVVESTVAPLTQMVMAAAVLPIFLNGLT